MIDLTCPRCGGMMELSPDKTKCNCPYCDNEMLVDSDSQQVQYGLLNCYQKFIKICKNI